MFAPKLTGMLGPLALVVLFGWLGTDTIRSWTGNAGEWLTIIFVFGFFALAIRLLPWTVFVTETGIRTRTPWGKPRNFTWDDVGELSRYRTHGRGATSGSRVILHGGKEICWDDHFYDAMNLASAISRRSGKPIVKA